MPQSRSAVFATSATRIILAGATFLLVSIMARIPAGAQGTLPAETPARFNATYNGYDYTRREVMIAMRDGAKLHTVILVPKGAHNAPILLTRTPYDANALTNNTHSAHLASSLYGYDNATDVIVEGGYIRVVQDVRGKYGSEGDYVMNRPLHGPQNASAVDHSTDTYDTIEWLINNIPETNRKVGILGISYDGFTPLMALVHPHPALKVSVPMNPMVDGWMGDDWFHNGAFRQMNMPYIYEQDGSRSNDILWWSSHFDDYSMYLEGGSAGQLGRDRGLEQMGFWQKIIAHPSYDAFWKDQAMDRILGAQPLQVPVMIVSSLWDQEDIYGALAVYKALEPKDVNNDKVFFVIGPWYHGQEIDDPSALGAMRFDSNTGLYFERNVLRPFLDHYLKDDAPKADVAPVMAFETGTNTWRRLNSWPSGCNDGCTIKHSPLYLAAGSTASFSAPTGTDAVSFDEYISDPSKPVPFRTRPIRPVGYDIDKGYTWPEWLVDDQRNVESRTDVVSYRSDVLTAPVKISGEAIANIVASTSGTDADWVVKLIDVYPDEVARDARMGGYELPIAMDIFRGRYRESLETPKPIASNAPLLYKFALPNANHVFLPGHRIMVQIQSSWFPLYDRNPQTFVPNIFFAKPSDYQKATQRIYRSATHASFVDLPVVNAGGGS